MRAWMTEVELIVPFEAEELESRRLRVEVESVIGRDYVLWIIPSRETASEGVRLEP